MNVKNSKPELIATELPLTNELNLALVEINDKRCKFTAISNLDNLLSHFKFRFSFVNNWHFIRAVWANQTCSY
jgi:hypothetical protein